MDNQRFVELRGQIRDAERTAEQRWKDVQDDFGGVSEAINTVAKECSEIDADLRCDLDFLKHKTRTGEFARGVKVALKWHNLSHEFTIESSPKKYREDRIGSRELYFETRNVEREFSEHVESFVKEIADSFEKSATEI